MDSDKRPTLKPGQVWLCKSQKCWVKVWAVEDGCGALAPQYRNIQETDWQPICDDLQLVYIAARGYYGLPDYPSLDLITLIWSPDDD